MPTVLHRLSKWADSEPTHAAQKYKVDGQWQTITVREFCDRVYYMALFLESQGLTPKDCATILAPNSHHWVTMDLAAVLLGAKSAGMYPNANTKDIQYILKHTEAKVLAVKDKEFYDKVLGEKKDLSVPATVKTIVSFSGETSFSSIAISYEAALAEGKRIAESGKARTLSELLSALDPKAPAFMIYTSGTTGDPKGAMLSNDNLVYTTDLAVNWWDLPMGNRKLLSFLPLCHIAEKMQNIGLGISRNYTVYYVTKFDAVSQELPEVNPDLLLSVPRLWEKMMEGVLIKVRNAPAPRRALAEWAMAVGARVADAKFTGQKPNPLDLVQLLVAEKLVLSKIRAALGLPNPHTLASGAAALPAHVAKWFRCVGLEILEDFGQTESSGVICMTERGVESAGTVGKPVTGTEFKLAEDGEVLTRGRHVFVGYYKDEALTASTLADGWLHTGDLGEMTKEGLVRIRGRKKEIMKSSGGKMVAPLPIEEELKANDCIAQACMVGDGRKYFSVIITLSESRLAALQKSGHLGRATVDEPKIVAEVQAAIDALNSHLSSYEQIKRFTILPREFSILENEMTPTLKMKRAVIEAKFKDLIDAMYR